VLDYSALSAALALLGSDWQPWLVIFPGMLIGLFFGAIPGLSISIAMAVFLPFTIYMDFLSALMFLTAIFTGGGFAGAIPAILINIPGAPTAVATAFDGYPMCQKGQHSEALGLALASSTLGCLFGYLVLMFLVRPLAEVVLMLGPTEMFLVALWGVTLIAALRERHFGRAIIAGLFGMILGTVGISAAGDLRGTFGSYWLMEGIPVVPAILGLFAASELFNLVRADFIVQDEAARTVRLSRIMTGFRLALRYPLILLRGSSIAVVVGALPGVGASVANLISYSEAKRRADDPEAFGTGDPRGIVAAESANSASEAGALATLLALGLPGGGATAVMAGALALHGVTGGPRFINERMDVVYALIIGNFIQAILLIAMGFGFVFLAAFIVRVRVTYLIPMVLAVCTAGSFSLAGNMIGPLTLVSFGVLGWVLRRYDYPVAAVAVGLLLGSLADAELLRSFQIIGGDYSYLLGRPISMLLLAALVGSFLVPAIRKRRAILKQRGT
jgi:putative tricarboxylic transport membrane protein